MHSRVDVTSRPARRGRRLLVLVVAIALATGAAGFVLWHRGKPAAHAATSPAVPVTVSAVSQRDVPIFLDSLGTVQASNTVADSQPDRRQAAIGRLRRRPGGAQGRHAGRDRSARAAGRARSGDRQEGAGRGSADRGAEGSRSFQGTAREGRFETQQSVDQQQGKVDQLKATIDADQAAIESAQTQLSYTTITAPIDGRVGFRQVDAGNIIHANDTNPLTVLTQIKPSIAIFTLPQKNLADVRDAMLRGPGAGHRLRSGQHAPACARRAHADRQSDRSDHQHDPPQGALRQRGRPALAGRVRAPARPGRHPRRGRDHSADGSAARPAGPLCLGRQTRQHRGAAPHRDGADRQRHHDRDQGADRRRAGRRQRAISPAGRHPRRQPRPSQADARNARTRHS